MNTHWTARSNDDFLFRIAADFVSQVEDKMEALGISQDELARKLGLSKGRISQFINNPGNLTLKKIVEYSRELNMKVAVLAYEDDDPDNMKGPINSEIFRICWEQSGKPQDFWMINEMNGENISTNDKQYVTLLPARAANKDISIQRRTEMVAQMPNNHLEISEYA